MAFIHGHTRHKDRTPTYISWQRMISRCTNPRDPRYPKYGGVGITVCERWLQFSAFLADMGERPQGKTIDRIKNDAGYRPDNCRWATPAEQIANSSTPHLIEFDGLKMSMADWSRRLGGNHTLVYCRLRGGMSIAQALTLPVKGPAGQHRVKGKYVAIRSLSAPQSTQGEK